MWQQGREIIERMLSAGELDRVTPSQERADLLLDQAENHLESATERAEKDPEGAYALLYDAARKALVAVLENQGLRTTSAGGHIGLYEAVSAQLDPPLGKLLRPFQRMRRRRISLEYPDFSEPATTPAAVIGESATASAIVNMARRVVTEMPPF